MFLNELKKEEALSFLKLVNIFSTVDNVIAKEEKRLIKDYLEELGLEGEVIGKANYEEVLSNLKNCPDRVKRIIYFELIGLALVDGVYEEKEVDFLDNLAVELNIPRDKRIAFANYFFNFKEIYDFSVVEANDKLVLLKEQAESLL